MLVQTALGSVISTYAAYLFVCIFLTQYCIVKLECYNNYGNCLRFRNFWNAFELSDLKLLYYSLMHIAFLYLFHSFVCERVFFVKFGR